MSATNYASIFDQFEETPSITIRGRTYPLSTIGSKDALRIRKRFPDFKDSIEGLQFLVEDDKASDDDLTDEALDRLVRVVEFTNAMVAIAMGHPGDETAEARIDGLFSDEEKAAIISKAQSLSTVVPDEGFSKPSV
ncbi:MAG: hypothetical protein GW854_01630 [Erythrobacter sp.]|nr:hypothetical protein [Erythrobacter sp.]